MTMVCSKRNGRYIHFLRPKRDIESDTRYVSVVKCKLGIRPAGFFSNSQSLSQFQFSVFTRLLYAVCVLGKSRHLCDATTWLAALWLAGEGSTSQRWGEWLPVYWRSARGTPGPNVELNWIKLYRIISNWAWNIIHWVSYLSLSGYWTWFSHCSNTHQHGITPAWQPPWNPEWSRVDLVWSTHKSAGHGWQTDKIVLTRILREISGRWAVWVRTQTHHCTTTSPPRWEGSQKLGKEKAYRHGFPGCD